MCGYVFLIKIRLYKKSIQKDKIIFNIINTIVEDITQVFYTC